MPQAGLNTTARAGPLAQLIVKSIINNPSIDPNDQLLYNPRMWASPITNTFFNASFDWLDPDVPKVINGRQDAFSITYASFAYLIELQVAVTEYILYSNIV
jgi:hypothetical protein